MECHSEQGLSEFVYKSGGNPMGSLLSRLSSGDNKTVPKLPARPRTIAYDCTHDNATPSERRHASDALPTMCLVGMCAGGVGTSVGYDMLLPRNVHVVNDP